METPVNKLEAMFQKAESDLGYLEKQLKFEFMTKMAESGAAEDNPVKLLEKLSAVKARHKALCVQMEEITKQQQQSMEAIRAHLSTTVQLVEQLQKSADVEVQPLREAEQAAAQALLGNTVEIPAASGASATVFSFGSSGLRGQLGKRNSGNPDALE